MHIILTNTTVDMSMGKISGDTTDIIFPSYVQITDADMCMNRELDADIFIDDLIQYCKLRAKYETVKFVRDMSNHPNTFLIASDPDIGSWAMNLAYRLYPNESLSIESISFYPAGGFSITCKIYMYG